MRRPLSSIALLIAALALLALAGCGSSKKTSAASSQSTAASQPATTQATTSASSGPCKQVATPAAKTNVHLKKPTQQLDPASTWNAVVTTSCGSFTIALDVKRAPKTASSFASLARKGFFDNLTFHRIATGFVIQGGDPLGDGTGGPGYTIVEKPPSSLQYTHGIVAMAKAGNEPDGASGSQFFVVTSQNAGLPPQYALVGKVVKGLDVVDAIGALPVQNGASDGPPVDPVVMTSVKIRRG